MDDTLTDTQPEIGELLNELRTIMDQQEEARRHASALAARRCEIENALIHRSEESGITSFANDQVAVTVAEDTRVKYDPDKWDSFLKWAVDNGHGFIVQRRITDAKVKELIAEGIALPDGVTIEGYTSIRVRRKN